MPPWMIVVLVASVVLTVATAGMAAAAAASADAADAGLVAAAEGATAEGATAEGATAEGATLGFSPNNSGNYAYTAISAAESLDVAAKAALIDFLKASLVTVVLAGALPGATAAATKHANARAESAMTVEVAQAIAALTIEGEPIAAITSLDNPMAQNPKDIANSNTIDSPTNTVSESEGVVPPTTDGTQASVPSISSSGNTDAVSSDQQDIAA